VPTRFRRDSRPIAEELVADPRQCTLDRLAPAPPDYSSIEPDSADAWTVLDASRPGRYGLQRIFTNAVKLRFNLLRQDPAYLPSFKRTGQSISQGRSAQMMDLMSMVVGGFEEAWNQTSDAISNSVFEPHWERLEELVGMARALERRGPPHKRRPSPAFESADILVRASGRGGADIIVMQIDLVGQMFGFTRLPKELPLIAADNVGLVREMISIPDEILEEALISMCYFDRRVGMLHRFDPTKFTHEGIGRQTVISLRQPFANSEAPPAWQSDGSARMTVGDIAVHQEVDGCPASGRLKAVGAPLLSDGLPVTDGAATDLTDAIVDASLGLAGFTVFPAAVREDPRIETPRLFDIC
jgi:hypothetical protein